MGIGNILNIDNKDKSPPKNLPRKGDIIGTGWESIVTKVDDNWVIKEINPNDPQGKKRSQEAIDYLGNPKRVKDIVRDQKKIGKIFGEEHFAKSYFRYEKDQSGKRSCIIIQRFIPGKVLSEMIGTDYRNTNEMIEKNREQFKDIIWGLKKTFIEFGVPLDFHPGNLIKNEKTGNIVIMDTGIPSREFKTINSNENSDRVFNTFKNAYERLDRMIRYERLLNLTEEEKSDLNIKYGITDKQYNDRLENLNNMKNKKGFEIDVVNPVDELLNNIFGERDKVGGQELLNYALKILGKKEPTESQKVILDELKKQSTILGNKDHWKEIIEL